MGLSLLNTLAWWQWAILAAVPPAIIALYFLKLKRRPVEVPSTYLWRRSIEDLHVNAIWQRLRRNLLLFLQLLLILLAMGALLRPGWRGETLTGNRFIFLIDQSASMQATDVEPNRLDEAKRRGGELIDQMHSGDSAMVISFSDTARVRQGFTYDRHALKRAVEQIEPTPRGTSLIEALKVASGLANPGRSAYEASDTQVAEALPATLYIMSDGNFEHVTGFSLGNLNPIYVPIGQDDAPNVGIVAFSIRNHETREGQRQAFARLENFGKQAVHVNADLRLDDRLIDATEVQIGPGEVQGVVFDLGAIESGSLKLEARVNDRLAVDNSAWIAVNPPRRANVLLVTPGNEPLAFGLATELATKIARVIVQPPEFLKSKDYTANAENGQYNLVIYDRCRPEKMPQANTLFIGDVPPGGVWSAGKKVDVPAILDTDPSHPIMQWIAMDDVLLFEGTPLTVPPGGSVLIDTDAGPMLAIASRESFEDAVLGFMLVEQVGGEKFTRTNWPIRPSFPVFVLNVLNYLGGGNPEVVGEASVRPGQAVPLESPALRQGLSVISPSGATTELKEPTGSRPGKFTFSGTGELGVYDVRSGGKTVERFAVNLFDPLESNLPPQKKFDVGPVEIEGKSGWEVVRREIWRWLVLAGLVVLVLEWYIYSRRVSW
jgi:hypothetical protein